MSVYWVKFLIISTKKLPSDSMQQTNSEIIPYDSHLFRFMFLYNLRCLTKSQIIPHVLHLFLFMFLYNLSRLRGKHILWLNSKEKEQWQRWWDFIYMTTLCQKSLEALLIVFTELSGHVENPHNKGL